MITTADWINIASVIVNICIAIWITHILQNKFTNNRTLKDHFINEIKDVRAEYKGFLPTEALFDFLSYLSNEVPH